MTTICKTKKNISALVNSFDNFYNNIKYSYHTSISIYTHIPLQNQGNRPEWTGIKTQ